MGLTVNRQMAKKSTVNRQKRNISRQNSFFLIFLNNLLSFFTFVF